MADDVNKSPLLGGINKLKERYSKPGAIESKYRLEADIAQGTMHDISRQNQADLIANRPVNGATMAERAQEYSAAMQDYNRYAQRADVQAAGREVQYAKAFDRFVNGYASPAESRSRIASMASSTSMLTGARSAMNGGQLSYPHLERAREKSYAELADAREHLMALGKEGPDADVNGLRAAESRVNNAESRIATIDSRMRVLKRSGYGTESLLERAASGSELVNNAYDQLAGEDRRNAIRDGKSININVLNDAIKKAAEDLKKAGNNLVSTLEDTSKSAAEVNEAISREQDARKNLETAIDTKRIAGAEGKIEQGGMMSKIVSFLTGGMTTQVIGGLHGAADVLNAGAKTTRHFGITRELDRASNQTAYANMANDQYDDVLGGINLNAAALRRARGMNAQAFSYGDSMAKWEDAATMMDAGEAIYRGAANTLTTMTDVKVGQAIGQGAQALANSAIAVDNVYTGNSSHKVNIAGYHTARNLGNAMNHVMDSSNQAYMDFANASVLGTRGMGGMRGDNLGLLQDEAFRHIMSTRGVAGQDLVGMMSAMSATVGSSMSSDYRSSFNVGSMLERAAAAQQSGYMSANQYMSNVGALASVGGNGHQLDKIMREAVAAGMDSSKNISEMVSATAGLAAGIAQNGGMAANSIGSSVSGTIQNLSQLDPNMRAAAAQSGLARVMSNQSDTSISLHTVMEHARLNRALPGFSKNALDVVKGSTVNELREMSSMTAQQIRRSGKGEFLNEDGTLNTAMQERAINAKIDTDVDRITGLFKTSPETAQAIKDTLRKAGGNLDIADQLNPKVMQEYHTMAGNTAYGAAVAEGYSRGGAKQGDLRGADAAEGITTARATATNKGISLGAENIGGFADLAKIVQSLSETFDPKNMVGAAEASAEKMNIPIKAFESSVGSFDRAVSKFETIIDSKMDPRIQKQIEDNYARASGQVRKKKIGSNE